MRLGSAQRACLPLSPCRCAPSPVLDAELETALAALLEQKRALSRALETQVAKSCGLADCHNGSWHCSCINYLLGEFQRTTRKLIEDRTRMAAAPPSTVPPDALLGRIARLEQAAAAAARDRPEVRMPPTRAPFILPGRFSGAPGSDGGGHGGGVPGRGPGGGGGDGAPGHGAGAGHVTSQVTLLLL